MGKRSGGGDMLKATYDIDEDGVVDTTEVLPDHAEDHENAGDDEISVTGLSGELADSQEAKAHGFAGARHVAATLEALNLKVSDATLDTASASRTPLAHKASHQDGGTDKIDCSGLVGRLNYVDRGDPDAFDWTQGNFTQDSTWRDLDLSSIVPAGAVLVLFRCLIRHAIVSKTFGLRKNGNSNEYSRVRPISQVANIPVEYNLIIECDEDRKVEYNAEANSWSNIDLVVMGWFV